MFDLSFIKPKLLSSMYLCQLVDKFLDRYMLRKREVLAAFLNIPSLVFCLHLLLYSSNIGHCPTPRRKETIFLLEKIKVDDGIFSGLNVKRRFSDYRF